MSNADDTIRNDRAHFWHPFTWMPGYLAREPIVITGADGIHLTTADGRELMDGISSMWLNVHGHNRPEIREAIVRQLERFAHVSVFGQTHEPAAQLARRLVEIAPDGLNHVFFSDDGATAVEVALKLVFQHFQIRGETKRTKFIALEHAYHGDTLGAVSVGDISHFHHAFRPLLFECFRAPSPACRVPDATGEPEESGTAALEELERLIDEHASEVCGFIIEPVVQGAAGMLIAEPGYLRGARELCTSHGIPMIADEVFVGFGRTGRMFACEHENVSPDVMCLAKGLTGGTLPLAATLANDELHETFLGADRTRCTFYHGHSYTANPLGCAAALATLDLFEKDGTLEHVRRLEKVLEGECERFAGLRRATGVRCKGLIFALDLVEKKEGFMTGRNVHPPGRACHPVGAYDPSLGMGQKVADAAMKRGLLIRPLDDVLYLAPPLVTAEKELRRMLDILYQSIAETTG
jgi:adenosylmethionine-8-amino-7-oxononanoate aminotransferase